MDWMRQRVPFHRSASVREELERDLEDPPTAIQNRRDGHATDDRKLIPALTGFGVALTFHALAAVWLDPPASDTPAVASAITPTRTVNDPSRLTASSWLRLGMAPPFPVRVAPRREKRDSTLGAGRSVRSRATATGRCRSCVRRRRRRVVWRWRSLGRGCRRYAVGSAGACSRGCPTRLDRSRNRST